jgi:hypothetical protein
MAKEKIKELKDQIKELKEKNARVADHNTLLMKEIKRAKIEDSIQTVLSKASGIGIGISGFILPEKVNPAFKWRGDKAEYDISILIIAGAIIVFWPQIKKYAPKALKLWKK